MLAAAGLVQTGAWAGVQDPEDGLPLRVDSAYPINYLGREVQVFGRYRQLENDDDEFTTEGRIEIGFPRNAEIKIGVPYIFGDVEPDGLGDVHLEFLYNFNQETLDLPAFSLATEFAFPTGDESEGVDTTIMGLMTRTLGDSWMYHQLHLNVGWHINDDVQPGERGGWYEVVVGYTRRINPATLLVVDFVREEDIEEDVEHNLAEIGLRYQLTPLTVISGGVGTGIGDESPDLVTTVGLQYNF